MRKCEFVFIVQDAAENYVYKIIPHECEKIEKKSVEFSVSIKCFIREN